MPIYGNDLIPVNKVIFLCFSNTHYIDFMLIDVDQSHSLSKFLATNIRITSFVPKSDMKLYNKLTYLQVTPTPPPPPHKHTQCKYNHSTYKYDLYLQY